MKTNRILTALFAALTLFATACSPKEPTKTVGKTHPEWSINATMYELNTRQFTPEGTFKAVAEHLPRLKELGVKIIWFMPIQPIGIEERKGELGSYYAISDYKGINPEFGTMEDFRAVVDEAHKLGMKVILDWVANHTSPDAVWSQNKDWYVRDSVGNVVCPYDWTDVAKLNYDNQDMRAAMRDAMKFWLTDANIDGFRCDVAGEVPTDFWEETVEELEKVKPGIFMLAEAEKAELQNNAFDAYYGWALHHVMNAVAQGKQNADSLRVFMSKHQEEFPVGISLNFTSNHDENSWNGTEFERMGDATKTFATLSYILPGMPLIYNGQEVGFDRRLEFFVKDSIDWVAPNEFTELYTSLNRLRKENEALHSSKGTMQDIRSSVPNNIFSIVRTEGENTILAIFNLSDTEVSATFDCKQIEGKYQDYFNREEVAMHNSATIAFAPWGYKILIKK